MTPPALKEVWLRGPLPGIPPVLQPVAYALLQAVEEVAALMDGFDSALLWLRPAGVASPGFHLQHLTGVLDRLFAYARQQQLTPAQLIVLDAEGKPVEMHASLLVEAFSRQVNLALKQLHTVDEKMLSETRGVGRSQIASTVIGLYVHAAEHTMRHVGQLTVTVKILKALHASNNHLTHNIASQNI